VTALRQESAGRLPPGFVSEAREISPDVKLRLQL